MNITSLASNPPGNAALNLLPERQTVNRATAVDSPLQAGESDQRQAIAKPKQEDVEQAVKQVNEFVRPINNALSFSLDQESDQMIVKVIDQGTKEVIRQIPSEEMLALAKALDTMKGLLVQQKA